jgi:hypothetical protein
MQTSPTAPRRMNDVLTKEKLDELSKRYEREADSQAGAEIHFELAKFALNSAYPPNLAVQLMGQLFHTFLTQLTSEYFMQAVWLRRPFVPVLYTPAMILRLCFAQPLLQSKISVSMHDLLRGIKDLSFGGTIMAENLFLKYKVIRPYILSVLAETQDAGVIEFLFDAFAKHFPGKDLYNDTRPLTEKHEELYRAFGRFLFARDVVRFYKAAHLLQVNLREVGLLDDNDVFLQRLDVAQAICKAILRNAQPSRAELARLRVEGNGPMRLLWALYQRSRVGSPAHAVYEDTLAVRYEATEELYENKPGFTVPLADKLFAWRVLHICNGLQSQRLPSLVLLTIIDEGTPNNYTMFKKWELITKVRHFLDRKQKQADEEVYGFY